MTADQPADQDSPWKEALEAYFEPFMALCFPAAHAGIDWRRGYVFLDKEFQRIVRDAKLGRRLADKLVKVWRRDGTEAWVLIHVEVQGQPDAEFPRRMYVYNYRIFDRYGRQVVSLAVLGDEVPHWRPDRYEAELWDCGVSFRFPVRKLLDYRATQALLEESDNPFAVVVLAHLEAQATRRQPDRRFSSRFGIVRRLYERGFSREDILRLTRFIDWLLVLPEELEQQFREAHYQLEQEKEMPYVSSYERLAKQEGRQEMVREFLTDELTSRFGSIPDEIARYLEQVHDLPRLRELYRLARTVPNLETFRQGLGQD